MLFKAAFGIAVVLSTGTLCLAQKHVSTSEALENATTKVQPTYPQNAKTLKIEGKVEVEAVVNESGEVDDVQIKAGNPILTRAASDAVRKWKFKPFTADGKPTKAVAPVSFTFKL